MSDDELARWMRKKAAWLISRAATLADQADRLEGRVVDTARAVCDVCGEETRVVSHFGFRCLAHKSVLGRWVRCTGTYRAEPERVRFRDGRELPITVDKLAAGMATAQAFGEADDGEEWPCWRGGGE